MRNTNTRQRQGRDFTLLEELNYLLNAEISTEGNYNNIDGIIGNAPSKDDYEAKTLLEQIEYNRMIAERNAAPADGDEPPTERSARERAR